ncbi:MAG: DNA polymerase III subunit epsilon [Gammaproteobacteria bacterium]|nr:DNA polymerase III subunit epsilon [Gammaproteobacteria bacterium]
MRQVVLDTETTGLEVARGHRIIEIGCVELINRRHTTRTFHRYVQPDREIDEAAIEVHGITNQRLANEPRFGEIVDDFVDFISGAELIIHNAEFDVGFLDNEFHLANLNSTDIAGLCPVIDTLPLARQIHPGQRNSLDALCKRYMVDNSGRAFHGALLDAQLLADVYLAMTGGQTALSLDGDEQGLDVIDDTARRLVDRKDLKLRVVRATKAEIAAHDRQLDLIADSCPDGAVWRKLDADSA